MFCRLAGLPLNSLHTCGLVTGMINSGSSLGAAVGPIIGGGLTDAYDFAWMGTVMAAMNAVMVSSSIYITEFLIK